MSCGRGTLHSRAVLETPHTGSSLCSPQCGYLDPGHVARTTPAVTAMGRELVLSTLVPTICYGTMVCGLTLHPWHTPLGTFARSEAFSYLEANLAKTYTRMRGRLSLSALGGPGAMLRRHSLYIAGVLALSSGGHIVYACGHTDVVLAGLSPCIRLDSHSSSGGVGAGGPGSSETHPVVCYGDPATRTISPTADVVLESACARLPQDATPRIQASWMLGLERGASGGLASGAPSDASPRAPPVS